MALVIGLVVRIVSFAAAQESQGVFMLPMWSNTNGWDDPSCYSTIQMADLDGDGYDELLGRCTAGIEANRFDPTTGVWTPLLNGPPWASKDGWDQKEYYLTIQTADLDGDGSAELLARDGATIIAYSYSAPKGKPTQGTWTQLPNGPAWASKDGWDQAQFYRTIQTADLDGDGSAELLARDGATIIAYSYSAPKGKPTQGTWSQLPNGPAWASKDGWDQKQFYLTIQTADLDGDGSAELLARDGATIIAYSYSAPKGKPTQGTWTQLPNGPAWASKDGWDQAQFYRTIQTADLDGDGSAELLARDGATIIAYSYSAPKGKPTQGTWSQLPNGPAWASKDGWDQKQFYLTIQTADLDGDGSAELLARDGATIIAYSYSAPKGKPTQGTWTQLPLGPAWASKDQWDQAMYYATIQSGNFDPDKKGAELLARDGYTIIAYGYSGGLKGRWTSFTPVRRFPQFTGEELAAYKVIQTRLDLQGKKIRNQYYEQDFSQLQFYLTELSTENYCKTSPNNTIDTATWNAVCNQIRHEMLWAYQVANAYSQNHTFLTPTFFDKTGLLKGVDHTLQIEKDNSDEVTAVFSDLFTGVIEALGIATGNVGSNIVGHFFASAVEAGVEVGLNTDRLETKYFDLTTKLYNNFQNLTTANENNRRLIATTYGLLKTVGTAFANKTWTFPASDTIRYQKNRAAILKKYTEFVWKTLTPTVWQIGMFTQSPDLPPPKCSSPTVSPPPYSYCYQDYWYVLTGNSMHIPEGQLKLLFGKTSLNCQTTFDSKCSMGIPLEEVYLDWCLPGRPKNEPSCKGAK